MKGKISVDNIEDLVKTAVGAEIPEENTASTLRDKMQDEIALAIGRAYDEGYSDGKNQTIDEILNMLHVFAGIHQDSHDAEITTECIKLVEMMRK